MFRKLFLFVFGSKKRMAISAVAGVFLFGVVTYTLWNVQRSFNYAWGYQSQVESTVCKMVQPQYLKLGVC